MAPQPQIASETRLQPRSAPCVPWDAVAEPAAALDGPERVCAWFAGLPDAEPGAHAPLFAWLGRSADRRALAWFVQQEVGLRRGLADQMALAQLGVPAGFKPQLAVGLWEELGQGVRGAMPDLLLDRLVAALGAEGAPVDEALRIADVGAALAGDDAQPWRAIGFLGATELTTAARAVRVDEGLRRLELPRRVRAYYARNARIDRRRARRWVREIVRPALGWRPELARPIAEGALVRMHLAGELWDRCARELLR